MCAIGLHVESSCEANWHIRSSESVGKSLILHFVSACTRVLVPILLHWLSACKFICIEIGIRPSTNSRVPLLLHKLSLAFQLVFKLLCLSPAVCLKSPAIQWDCCAPVPFLHSPVQYNVNWGNGCKLISKDHKCQKIIIVPFFKSKADLLCHQCLFIKDYPCIGFGFVLGYIMICISFYLPAK